MKLYIIRHGETDWNKAWRLQGQTDTDLNEYGRELARITCEGIKDLKIDRVFSSPLRRAVETAELVTAGRGLTIETDERLKEVGFGINEGKLPEEREPGCKLFFTQPAKYVPSEGGETLNELVRRTGEFLDEVIRPMSLTDEMRDGAVLISGHGAMNKALMLNLKGHGLENFWDGEVQHNCSINTYEIVGDKCIVIKEGEVFYDISERRP